MSAPTAPDGPALPGAAVVDEVLQRVAGLRIAVVGDLMLDEYTDGRIDRLSPEAAVPVVVAERTSSNPGGAANAARGIHALGATVEMFGVVGDDAAAQELVDLCAGIGIGIDGVLRRADRRTTRKHRVVANGQQVVRVDHEDTLSIDDAAVDALSAQLAAEQFDALVVSDYGKGVVSDRLFANIVDVAHRRGIPVLVDPTLAVPHRYLAADLVKSNHAEMRSLMSAAGLTVHDAAGSDPAQSAADAERLRTHMGWPCLVVTMGSLGMVIAARDAEPVHVPTYEVEVADESGAGDTVMATLAVATVAGLDVTTAAELANAAATTVVTRRGVVAATAQDLLAAASPASAPIVSRSELRNLVNEWSTAGEATVLTNGCFDLLHGGHLHLLRAAAQLGTRLIVAVDTDESVRRLKGDARPVRSAEARCAAVAAVPGVDAVVTFESAELSQLVTDVGPAVLAKGADYVGREVVGRSAVEAAGGQVVLVPLLPGYSTTALVADQDE